MIAKARQSCPAERFVVIVGGRDMRIVWTGILLLVWSTQALVGCGPTANVPHEADYVGLYYAARAGYDPFVAEGLWRRMGMMDPKSITFARTHPATAERAVSMRQTATEINNKRALGLPLIPALKEPDATASTSMTEAEIEDRQFGKDD